MLQYIRIFWLIPCLIIFTLSLIKLRYSSLIIFLTQWGNHLVILAQILTIQSGMFKYSKHLKLKRLAAVTMQVAFVTQIIIVSIYWPKLHHLALKKIEEEQNIAFRTYLYYHMLFIHSLPFVGILINVILSRVVFIPGHCIYLAFTGMCYNVVNYLGVKYRGHPLYPFLPWTDYKSVLIGIGIVVSASFIYMVVCFVVH